MEFLSNLDLLLFCT